MSLFLETLRVEAGRFCHVKYHNQRLNRTIQSTYGIATEIDLSRIIQDQPEDGIYRCRVLYDTEVREVEYIPHEPTLLEKFKFIEADLDYSFKSADRSDLMKLWEKRGECDDVIIIKEGFVTDSAIANIAIFDGEKWLTPARPLLPGTTRERLVDEGKLILSEVTPQMVRESRGFAVMNAMMDFYEIENPVFE